MRLSSNSYTKFRFSQLSPAYHFGGQRHKKQAYFPVESRLFPCSSHLFPCCFRLGKAPSADTQYFRQSSSFTWCYPWYLTHKGRKGRVVLKEMQGVTSEPFLWYICTPYCGIYDIPHCIWCICMVYCTVIYHTVYHWTNWKPLQIPILIWLSYSFSQFYCIRLLLTSTAVLYL